MSSKISTYYSTAFFNNFSSGIQITDIAMLPASATNRVRLKRATLMLIDPTTTLYSITAKLIKRSTLDTGGTSSAMSIVPANSSNPSSTITPVYYSSNPTTGTEVGGISFFYGINTQDNSRCEILFGQNDSEAPELAAGSTECFVIDLDNTIFTTGSITPAIFIAFEYQELF